MAKKKKKGHDEGHHADERWLLTYADMITLLLALFIVLFAMSSLDAKRFEDFAESLSASFKGEIIQSPGRVAPGSNSVLDAREARTAVQTRSPNAVNDLSRQQQRANRSRRQIEATLQQSGMKVSSRSGQVGVEQTMRGIVITLAGDAFFDSGSSAIKPSMVEPLRKLAQVLRDQAPQLSIEGHTDGAPINTAQFPDNLALSTARAESIWRFLRAAGINPGSMGATGYGEFRPKIEPDTPRQSVAENRRVEIVLLSARTDSADTINANGLQVSDGATESAAPEQAPIDPFAEDIIGPILDNTIGN